MESKTAARTNPRISNLLKASNLEMETIHVEKGANGQASRAVRQQDLIAFVWLIKFGRLGPSNLLLQLIFWWRHDNGKVLANHRSQTGRMILRKLLWKA